MPNDGEESSSDNLGNEDTNLNEASPVKTEPVKRRFAFDIDKTADMIVEGVDGLQHATFTLAYSMACFTKEDRKAIRNLKRLYKEKGGNKKEITLTQNDLQLMDSYEDFEEYAETVLPLTDKEKSSLSSALCGIMEEMNFNPSPKKALIISSVLIAIPRILPILYKYVNKVVSQQYE